MKKLMMIMAMVAVIAMANSAMASEYYSWGDRVNSDFFDTTQWSTGVVPTAGDSIRFGELGTRPNAIGSMYYDPATTSDPLDYTVGASGQWVMLGRHQAGDVYTFSQESGNLTWASQYFDIGYGGVGYYLVNGGTATFQEGLSINADGTLQFGAGSDGVVYWNSSGQNGKTKAEIDALISADKIDDLGGEGFVVTEMTGGDLDGYTEVKLVAAAPVPEPAGLGLIGLALLAVRRKRS